MKFSHTDTHLTITIDKEEAELLNEYLFHLRPWELPGALEQLYQGIRTYHYGPQPAPKKAGGGLPLIEALVPYSKETRETRWNDLVEEQARLESRDKHP